eukprot:13359426-Ditylum_brightwellii.AAC.1
MSVQMDISCCRQKIGMWYYDIKDGELIDHPKLPLIWPPQSKGTEAKSNRTEECDVVGHETN